MDLGFLIIEYQCWRTLVVEIADPCRHYYSPLITLVRDGAHLHISSYKISFLDHFSSFFIFQLSKLEFSKSFINSLFHLFIGLPIHLASSQICAYSPSRSILNANRIETIHRYSSSDLQYKYQQLLLP